MAATRAEKLADQKGRPAWQDLLGSLGPGLAITGALLYGALTVAYARFYGELGVNPSDVGLGYATTLSNSIGALLLFPLLALYLFGIAYVLERWDRWYSSESRSTLEKEPPSRSHVRLVIQLAAVLVPATMLLVSQAGDRASQVEQGYPVHPNRVGPVTVLAVRADPVVIEESGKPEDEPSIGKLKKRPLLYLGQANGVAVLYDTAAQQAVYLPQSTVLLKVGNCATKRSPDPACKRTFKR